MDLRPIKLRGMALCRHSGPLSCDSCCKLANATVVSQGLQGFGAAFSPKALSEFWETETDCAVCPIVECVSDWLPEAQMTKELLAGPPTPEAVTPPEPEMIQTPAIAATTAFNPTEFRSLRLRLI